MKVEDKLYGYTNYPRRCPKCKQLAHWKWIENVGANDLHDTINECESCGAKLLMKTRKEKGFYYGKPTYFIENWKWKII